MRCRCVGASPLLVCHFYQYYVKSELWSLLISAECRPPQHFCPDLQLQGYISMLSIKDIVPAALNNITTQFILWQRQLWGEECDLFKPGDIIHLTNGIFSYNRNHLLLRAGKRGSIKKVGEFTMTYVETPNISEIRWVPDPNNSKKYVQEAVISTYSRIFPPML
ncbi:uncharacterized protein J3R85_004905 [Psidium guajava]|nr:uncharacterized protein J3R85_004905 [Psidium guajava]